MFVIPFNLSPQQTAECVKQLEAQGFITPTENAHKWKVHLATPATEPTKITDPEFISDEHSALVDKLFPALMAVKLALRFGANPVVLRTMEDEYQIILAKVRAIETAHAESKKPVNTEQAVDNCAVGIPAEPTPADREKYISDLEDQIMRTNDLLQKEREAYLTLADNAHTMGQELAALKIKLDDSQQAFKKIIRLASE